MFRLLSISLLAISFIFRIDRATNGPQSVYRNRATFTGERVITGSSSHTSAASFEGIPMDSMITMKVYAVGKVTFNLFPNCHGGVMYGSVDNSWNDCINEKNLIIKNNKSYIAARDQIASAQNTPARATCQHNCTCM